MFAFGNGWKNWKVERSFLGKWPKPVRVSVFRRPALEHSKHHSTVTIWLRIAQP